MNKQDILNRIDDFTAEQLLHYIGEGTVELSELKATGDLDASKRRAIVSLQNERDLEDDKAWNNSRFSEQGCKTYLEQYPTGRNIEEAKKQIVQFKHLREVNERSKKEILDKVRRNPNSFTPKMIKDYLNDDSISRSDLIDCGIPNEVIDRLDYIVSPQLQLGGTPTTIPDGYTEVYFWGIPGSGKTCVLSAVLSAANRKGYLEMAAGPGYNYMTQLKNIFSNPIAFLPGPSPTDSTQYLPFVLKKENDDPRSVSLIELSGEIFQCFYKKISNKELPTPQHEETLNTLLRFLEGNNRKIHFFFIDYEKENRLDVDGLTQADYLGAAANYFKNNDIFSKSTDAIYMVITKSDLMECEKNERINSLKDYLSGANFTSFRNSLKTRCKENSINSGKIIGTHFSLGNVYFQQICSFDSETSENIIDILMRRIAPNKRSILDVFNT